LDHYILPLKEKGIEALILSCTHYSFLKDIIRERYGMDVIAQDEIVPAKLVEYLKRHPEIDRKIRRGSKDAFFVTDLTENYAEKTSEFYGMPVNLKVIEVSYG
ncbi:MAG: glutamate racemase, partial [Alphaproteobacteria bacterium]|nr:glutamate racemase [Alphaproteobacteria bacterium]